MDYNLPLLKKVPLFANIAAKDLNALLCCLAATQKTYAKNDFIFTENEKISAIGILQSGSAQIIKEDLWGNRTIIELLETGGLFGEAFSCAQTKRLPVAVLATVKTKILWINYQKIISTCPSSCPFHTKLIQNMLQIIAAKNIMLTQKIEHITQRTTRSKLLSYLSAQAKIQQKNSFTIPFNRQELADYLSVDRSAMSSELSKMQREGLLQYKQNHFTLAASEANPSLP